MKLLINESPLLVLPSLALLIGVDEAILLQQLNFRLNHQGVERKESFGIANRMRDGQSSCHFGVSKKLSACF